jgi:hypothetical protein
MQLGFLADDPHELAPPGIRDRTSQPTVSNHTHDVEVLNVDHLVVANQRQRLLMVIVPPRPRDLVVGDGDFAPRFVSVVGSFLPAGLLPL